MRDRKQEATVPFDAVSIGLGVAAAGINGDRSGLILLMEPLNVEQARAVARVSTEALAGALKVLAPVESLELLRTLALGRAAGGGLDG